MKLNYTFSNLCGVVYNGGNAIFAPDGRSLLSPVGHRVSVFDLDKETSFTLPFRMNHPIKYICTNPIGTLLFVVDESGRSLLVSLLSHATLSFLTFSESLTAPPQFSPDGRVIAVAVGRGIEIWRVPDFASANRQFAPWQLVKRIVQHQAPIVNLNWSSDDFPSIPNLRKGFIGRWICSASEDLTCRVFKIEYRSEVTPKTSFINNIKAQRETQEESEYKIELEEEEEEINEEGGSDLIEIDEEDLKSSASNLSRKSKVQLHRPLVISVHRHQPILAAFHHDAETGVYLLTLSKEGSLFVWDFNAENGRLKNERAQKYKIIIDPESESEYNKNKNTNTNKNKNTNNDNDNMIDDNDHSTAHNTHNSVTNISSTGRPERWARIRSIAFRDGKLLAGFTDGIFGLFRVDPQLERVDRLYALSLFNPETVGDALNPGIGIDCCDLSAGSADWLAFGCAKTGQLLVWEWSSENYILRLSGSPEATCSAYSPDGQLIATGGVDGKIRIWRGESSSECVATFSDHVGPITALAFTKQGHVLISASQDGSVRAFDVLRFRAFKVLRPPQPVQFSSLAVDCAGEIVAAGTLDTHEIYLWSLQNGQLVDIFSGHTGPITSLAFEPTRGRILASGSWDRLVRLWDVYAGPTDKAYGDPFTHESDVLSLSFRPDGVELTVSTLAGQLITWSVEGGLILSTIDGRLDISTNKLTGAAFHTICHSADGSCLLAAGSFSSVALYHLPTRTLLKQYPIFTLFTPSGKGLLAPKIDSFTTVARSILFSPSGRSWSVLTPHEGLLIFSTDPSLLFDPFELTPDLSAESVHQALNDGKHLQALVMALRLNLFPLQRATFDSIPSSTIPLLISQLPPKYLPNLLEMLAALCDPLKAFPSSPFPLQKLVILIRETFAFHCIRIKSLRAALLPTLRIIQKALLTLYKDLAGLVRDNIFEINRILLNSIKCSEK